MSEFVDVDNNNSSHIVRWLQDYYNRPLFIAHILCPGTATRVYISSYTAGQRLLNASFVLMLKLMIYFFPPFFFLVNILTRIFILAVNIPNKPETVCVSQCPCSASTHKEARVRPLPAPPLTQHIGLSVVKHLLPPAAAKKSCAQEAAVKFLQLAVLLELECAHQQRPISRTKSIHPTVNATLWAAGVYKYALIKTSCSLWPNIRPNCK